MRFLSFICRLNDDVLLGSRRPGAWCSGVAWMLLGDTLVGGWTFGRRSSR